MIRIISAESKKPFPYPLVSYNSDDGVTWLTDYEGKRLYRWKDGKRLNDLDQLLYIFNNLTVASIFTRQNEIWLGSDNGLTVIDTQVKDPLLDIKPRLNIRSIKLGVDSIIWGGFGTMPETPMNDKLYLLQYDIIKKAAESPCVIVGRCADHVLADRKDCVKLYIYCDLERRLEHIMNRYKLTADKAREKIKKNDRARSNYYNHYASGKWGEPQNYDLCINSAKLGVYGTCELIMDYLRHRGMC